MRFVKCPLQGQNQQDDSPCREAGAQALAWCVGSASARSEAQRCDDSVLHKPAAQKDVDSGAEVENQNSPTLFSVRTRRGKLRKNVSEQRRLQSGDLKSSPEVNF